MKVITGTKRPVKVWATDLEPEAEKQVLNMADMPFIYSHVAVMPDAHAGRGSTVGTVIATQGAIIPAAVGVDIGCGMRALKLPFKVDDLVGGDEGLRKLRHSIERDVPTGWHINQHITDSARTLYASLGAHSTCVHQNVASHILIKAPYSLGSLGGGNHFIEICTDQDNSLWIVLHSGSRGIGNALARVHIDRAKEIMKEYFISLPDPDLAYLAQGTPEFKAYLIDLMWAQRFAKASREEMMERVKKQVYRHLRQWSSVEQYAAYPFNLHHLDMEYIDCHHNYTAIENFGGHNVYITRKGAVSARKDEMGIIPGSMGAKSFIVKGLGNEDSFCSCSHGAGRKMSRTKARATFTAEDLANQTSGIECRKDVGILDEIPSSYKDIDEVMANQADLVTPVYQLKQLICVKGD